MDVTEPKMEVDSAPEKTATNGTETQDKPEAAAASNVCGVCEANPSKYKCPRCYLPYCSVACNKLHRENHPPDPEPAAPAAANDSHIAATTIAAPQPDDDDNDDSPYRTLRKSDKLQWLFRKYPRLPAQLLEIHAAMQEPPPPPERARIPASLLKDLPPQQGRADGWDRDKALAQGREALRKARAADGVDGDALREYTELVLYLMEEQGGKTKP